MASEPINLFARLVAPSRVRAAVLERHPDATVVGSDDDWREITIRFGKGRRAKALTLMHSPDYYAEPGWAAQVSGMQGYFARFPDPAGRLPRVLDLIGSFRFALATRFEPDWDDPSADDRFGVVCGLTGLLDGVIFTPSGLRDAGGRLLFGAGGEFDPDAVWPHVPVTAPAVADGVLETGDDGPDPPTPDRVARRAAALAAVTGRAVVEREYRAKAASAGEAKKMLANLRAWADDMGAADEYEPDERAVLDTKPGKLSDRQFIDSMWRIEGLAVLAWALGLAPLPRYDAVVNIDDVWQPLGFPKPEAKRWATAPTLRPPAELDAYRKQVLGIHWRLRQFAHVKPQRMDFRAFAADNWFGGFDPAGIELIDDELALGGVRLDQASEDTRGTAGSITRERHHAINWLYYGPAVYSEVYVGT